MDKQEQGNKEIIIGMGELAVSSQPSMVLTCLGVGSCVALCAFDPVTRIGGIAHIVLPHGDNANSSSPSKYANFAVPALLQEISRHGGEKSRLVIKVVGGAQMSTALGFDGTFKIGERNVQEILSSLEREGVSVFAMETGGTKGRTVRMYLDTGKVVVQSVGISPKEL